VRRIAGTVLVIAVLFGGLIAYGLWNHRHQAGRDARGDISKAGTVGASNIAVGDCFHAQDGSAFDAVSAVPCDQPHTAQAFGAFDYPNPPADRPDAATLAKTIQAECDRREAQAVDKAKVPASAVRARIAPSAASWTSGWHQILCLYQSTTPWTGSIMK
jgi:hypothetical protein